MGRRRGDLCPRPGALIDVQAGTFVGGSNGNENWAANRAGWRVAAGAAFYGVEANVVVDALTGGGTIFSGLNGGGYQRFTFGRADGSGTFSGVLADFSTFAGNYEKTGAGTQVLTGTSTYTGTTAISGGRLVVDGSIATSRSPRSSPAARSAATARPARCSSPAAARSPPGTVLARSRRAARCGTAAAAMGGSWTAPPTRRARRA